MDEINIETIDLNDEPLKLVGDNENKNDNSDRPSVNFGPGIELLMNDKKKSGPSSDGNIDLGDLNALENELNGLSAETNKPSLKEARSVLFSGDSVKSVKSKENDSPIIGMQNQKMPNLKLPHKDNKPDKTWDGYGKFNDIPVDPTKQIPTHPQLSKEELLREKFKYLRKLEALEKKGVNLSKKYTMESSLPEMQGEYETIVSDKEQKNSVKFQGRMLMAAITGLEFLNNKFDPFDLKLDGWSEQVNENIDDYDEIFGELHEKYKSKAKMAPELKLMFQLTGSAIMLHMTNTMFKSSMPGMDDIMKNNPELMQQFTQAAVNQMGQENKNFGGFVNNIMRPDVSPPQGAPPPPPMRTKNSSRMFPENPPNRRPDIGFGRGQPEEGISITEVYENPTAPPRSERPARPDMKGPSDINSLLSGLKSKEDSLFEPPQRSGLRPTNNNNDSNISISDLKEIQNEKMPAKKGSRRKKSEKNTVSLDI